MKEPERDGSGCYARSVDQHAVSLLHQLRDTGKAVSTGNRIIVNKGELRGLHLLRGAKYNGTCLRHTDDPILDQSEPESLFS